ncbi:NERD domain-containing protein [Bacillus freudenreichii]|nr:NERD domain-containing protein [Bacillus freudenreichii]
MIIKAYQEPLSLHVFRYLIQRLELPPEGKQLYFRMEKGHEGEHKMAGLLEGLPNNWVILHDLLLECNNSAFQIDALLISNELIYLLEVKNFEGDFYIESDQWFTGAGKEIQNPILQLNRSESLFRQSLRKLGLNLPIKGLITFTHPEFALFQAPLNFPIVLPSQLNRFITQLRKSSAKPTQHLKRFAEKLAELHIEESPYERLPHYEYKQLEKGIVCAVCSSLLISFVHDRRILCTQCGDDEALDASIMRSIRQFQLLFPDKKLTTNVIYDWCKIIDSKKTLRRVLRENFSAEGSGKHTYYL